MPFNWNLFPWTKFNDINLDWFLGQFKHTQDVMEHAEEAVETIDTYDVRIAAAESHATTALQEAGDAVADAVDAKETAEGIAGTANQALTTAQSAVDTANHASNTASGAYDTAGNALTVANGIDAKATQAINTASAAESKADEAYDLALSTQVRMIDIEEGVTGSVPNFKTPVIATLQADHSHTTEVVGSVFYRISTNNRFIQIGGRVETLIASSSQAAGNTYDVKFVIPNLNVDASMPFECAGMYLEGNGTPLPITLNHIASIYELYMRLENEGTGLAVRLRGFHSVTAEHRSVYFIPPIIIQLADNTPEFDSD